MALFRLGLRVADIFAVSSLLMLSSQLNLVASTPVIDTNELIRPDTIILNLVSINGWYYSDASVELKSNQLISAGGYPVSQSDLTNPAMYQYLIDNMTDTMIDIYTWARVGARKIVVSKIAIDSSNNYIISTTATVQSQWEIKSSDLLAQLNDAIRNMPWPGPFGKGAVISVQVTKFSISTTPILAFLKTPIGIGIICGVGAALLLLVCICYCCCRKKMRKAKVDPAQPQPQPSAPPPAPAPTTIVQPAPTTIVQPAPVDSSVAIAMTSQAELTMAATAVVAM